MQSMTFSGVLKFFSSAIFCKQQMLIRLEILWHQSSGEKKSFFWWLNGKVQNSFCFLKIGRTKKGEGFANKRLQCHMIVTKATGHALFPFRALVSHIQSATVFCCVRRVLVSSFFRWFVIVHMCVWGLVNVLC